MTESIVVDKNQTRAERYQVLLPQLKGLIEGESNEIANLSNIAAALKATFDFLWIGFYQIDGKELVLGPFQGPVACTRIGYGKGVCGTAWEKRETIIVDDVDDFPGHIACSSDSRSEIVVPTLKNGEVQLVLDIDSNRLSDFDAVDKKFLEEICQLITRLVLR
jgi:L-methionine (R)-S-oxide reductase